MTALMDDTDDEDFADLDAMLAELDDDADPDNVLIDPDEAETFEDELDAHIEERMADPEYAQADEVPISRPVSEGSGAKESIRGPLISGHCAFPGQAPEESHRRCAGYNRANPGKIFQPCPCSCHFPEDRYECGCGATLAEAPHYPLDEDGDVRYVHVDPKTGRMVDGECPR